MARYLVTGGAGFIGSHLCELLLAENHQVCILDSLISGATENIPHGAEFIQGSLNDRVLLSGLMDRVDGCFHLAAIASVPLCNEHWLHAHRINLTNTLKIIESARGSDKRKPIPIVFASSAAVYGNNETLPLKENSVTKPISVYGINKLSSEYYFSVASELFKIPCTVLRLFNVYGPRQRPDSSYSGVITRFIDNLTKGLPLTIYGTGEQTRDFIYVSDVARFFLRAMETNRNSMRCLNVCRGQEVSIVQVGETLYHIFQRTPDIQFEPSKPGDILHSRGCPDLAHQELGIQAEISLETGLKLLVKHVPNGF